MVEYMLANIINHEFEKVVGKNQYESRKAMHIGFRMSTANSKDQYQICHMYIFGPHNYVHVATQSERIDGRSGQHVNPMVHLCYHDSCWRDSVQKFIFDNRNNLYGFQSLLKLFDWYDVIELTVDEREYLSLMDKARDVKILGSNSEKEQIEKKLQVNPFDNRSVWKNKETK